MVHRYVVILFVVQYCRHRIPGDVIENICVCVLSKEINSSGVGREMDDDQPRTEGAI